MLCRTKVIQLTYGVASVCLGNFANARSRSHVRGLVEKDRGNLDGIVCGEVGPAKTVHRSGTRFLATDEEYDGSSAAALMERFANPQRCYISAVRGTKSQHAP